MSSHVTVRPLRRGEGPRLRELRLRALHDAPDAFGATAERDAARPAAHWENLPGTMLVAERDGEWLGMTGAFADPDMPTLATVWGMWVAPGARGDGIGRRLLDAVREWARGSGLARLEITVTDRAPGAEALYEAFGFRHTGRTRPLPRDPTITERFMALRFTPDLPLETERLRLRAYTEDDLADLLVIQSREDVTRFLPWGPRDEAGARRSLALKIAATGVTRDELTLVLESKATGAMLGDASMWSVNQEHRQGEIGYLLHPDHQGHGYMTEACAPLLAIGFRCFGMRRIVGRIEARNTASARVLERLGMRREAHLVENEYVRGEWQSEIVYAMLAAEWRQSQFCLRK